jgi:hypothetical protein
MSSPVIELHLTLNGIKTTFSAEICHENFPPLSVDGLNQLSYGYTEDDLLEIVILPSLMEVTQQLVGANRILSGNLEKHHLDSLRTSL